MGTDHVAEMSQFQRQTVTQSGAVLSYVSAAQEGVDQTKSRTGRETGFSGNVLEPHFFFMLSHNFDDGQSFFNRLIGTSQFLFHRGNLLLDV